MIILVSWKEEFKQAGLELGFDLLLVALIVCWVAAILTAILEVSLWVVFGLFFLGCVFLFSMFTISRNSEEAEKKALALENVEDTENEAEEESDDSE